MSERSVLLALNLDGAGNDPKHTAYQALRAESAGFNAVSFSSDGLLDAVQRASYVAAQTRRIGLLPVIDVLFTEPFHTATQLASLDIISRGRAGWILETHNDSVQAQAVGRTVLADDELSIEAAEVVTTHRRLWDSWEDDAVVRDAATGRYLDANKLHYVDVEGRNFSVKGPAITPRPPQGQLPIIAPSHLFSESGLQHCRLNGADVIAINTASLQTLLAQATASSTSGAVAIELDIYLDTAGQTGAQRAADIGIQSSERAVFAGSTKALINFLAEFAEATANPADQRRHLVHLYPGDLEIDGAVLIDEVLPQLKYGNLLAPNSTTLRENFALPVAQNRFQEAS
ncbi:LLM class flavin-dependent oxidoreductase [Glutamicibacter halophytocola]|uniref:LLM class flavin-dependent oxidoreductase n=1 Tax=Glutamicibacter halophytocola TaxID=1933880 RepID=A0A5B8IP43_9MICC|nr:LLM class flavin-dependent oxidoreductase [Glutamicibacter halophytocola]QDY66108.1 LLM class flavin-dependent oxidoreductase [Glutamicibacter halophytocola]UUX58210.1 LLM class flavin-dependent oxidoreductase [Glutamicibacter halophytocola]